MTPLATALRAAQFYAHAAHNLAKGESFFADHEYLGELYVAYESAYDDVIERMIGLKQPVDISKITLDAANMANQHEHESVKECFDYLMQYEKLICNYVAKFNNGASLGTQNFLQGIADDSEKRQFLIGQRLK